MNNTDVVKKLIGNIVPVGDSYVDTERILNLTEMTDLIEDLVKEVIEVSKMDGHYQHSIQNANKHAIRFLQELVELINNT